ncbi:MAG: tellurium resistance protein, partial [Paracoccaceae bacterium]
AAVLAPYSGALGRGVLVVALGAHLLIAALSARALMRLPLNERRMTGAWHLTFVGFIIAPIAAVPLGWDGLALVIQLLSLAMAIVVWGGCALMLARAPVTRELRPTLVIHLSPVCLFGIAAALLGHETIALIFGWSSVALAAVLLLRVRYLVADGFGHGWGAFTFPIAAFTNLMLLLSPAQGAPFRAFAALALIFASVSIVVIATRIVAMWFNGSLAVQSGVARA